MNCGGSVTLYDCTMVHRYNSEKIYEFIRADAGIALDTLEKFWMKCLLRVKRYSDPFSRDTLANHVAAALPRQLKSCLLQHSDDFASGDAGQFRHQIETSTVEKLTDFSSTSSSW